jgi:hypothetical protein
MVVVVGMFGKLFERLEAEMVKSALGMNISYEIQIEKNGVKMSCL